MDSILVDSNILLDLFTENSEWYGWSSGKIAALSVDNMLIINPIIYAEISYRFSSASLLDTIIAEAGLIRQDLPWEAAFLAAKAHWLYRQRGGQRVMALPDFFIGAHASVTKLPLLTRDVTRYQGYFPQVKLIAP